MSHSYLDVKRFLKCMTWLGERGVPAAERAARGIWPKLERGVWLAERLGAKPAGGELGRTCAGSD